MDIREHEKRDDVRAWLLEQELGVVLEATSDTEHYLAYAPGLRCGLRSQEVLDVAPNHVVERDAGHMLQVWEGKGDQYRETPVPPGLAARVQTIEDVRTSSTNEPLLDCSTRTLRRWVSNIGAQLAESEEDAGWTYLSYHDLRRTWATNLGAQDVDPLIVLDWGGWNDLDTFLDHYRGIYSPEAQQHERNKDRVVVNLKALKIDYFRPTAVNRLARWQVLQKRCCRVTAGHRVARGPFTAAQFGIENTGVNIITELGARYRVRIGHGDYVLFI